MPGPGRAFGPALAAAVRAGDVDEALVDAQVARLLTVFERIGALDDDGPGDEGSVDLPDHRRVAREAATGSMVLLANDGLLPFDRATIGTVAVIGPNADRARIMGGGSASLRAHYVVTPLEALRSALGDGVTVVHEPGCDNRKATPVLGGARTAAPSGTGEGFDVDWFANGALDGDPVHHSRTPAADVFGLEPPVPGLGGRWSFRAHTTLTPDVTGAHVFTLVQAGAGASDRRRRDRHRRVREPATPGHRVLRDGQRRGRGARRADRRRARGGGDRVRDRPPHGRPADRPPPARAC
jgi:beta-glucosidase